MPLPLEVLVALDLQTGLLGLEIGGVIALIRVGMAAVELEDPLGDVVEEVPVVRHGEDGAGVFRQMLLQPGDGLGVEMVGRLVQQKQVRLLEQQLAECDPATLTTGELGDVGIARRQPQRIHGLIEA